MKIKKYQMRATVVSLMFDFLFSGKQWQCQQIRLASEIVSLPFKIPFRSDKLGVMTNN